MNSLLHAEPGSPWTESAAWASAAKGWRPLGGSFLGEGFSLEWHDLSSNHQVNWGDTFHPRSVEICLNECGQATIGGKDDGLMLSSGMFTFYVRGDDKIEACREIGEQHRFLTVELSFEFLRNQLKPSARGIHPLIHRVVLGETEIKGVGPGRALSMRQEALLKSLRDPPVHSSARGLWFQGKALEIMAETLFEDEESQFFCSRQKRLAQERAAKVVQILRENMTEPPSLKEISIQVACSPYYLSRTFSQETGMTIPQYLRRLRMERAEKLLRTGKYNVTEVAMEVGYNSLSHFSQAFCQTTGSCPAIYQAKLHAKNSKAS